jgi:tRNA G18 (ribose-2'-O)-methylase SpoU
VPDEAYPLCLVVGNEVQGVDDELIEVADLGLELPQYGAKISMNVGVAYGIAVYDLVRRSRSLFGPPGGNNRTTT